MSEVITFEEFLFSKYGLTLKEFDLLYSDILKDAIRHMYATKYNDKVPLYVVIATTDKEDSDVVYVGKDKELAYSITSSDPYEFISVELWMNGIFVNRVTTSKS